MYQCLYCDKEYEKANSKNKHQLRCKQRPQQPNLQQVVADHFNQTQIEAPQAPQEGPQVLVEEAKEPDEPEENEENNEEESESDEESEEEVVQVIKKKTVKSPPKKPIKKKLVERKRAPLGSVEVLCNDFVKLSNSLKSSIKKKGILRKVLFTILKDKCAEHRLNKAVVEKIIELLKSDQDTQEIHFRLDKNVLFKEYFNFSFTLNQMKVIEDLSNVEVNEENINQQLVFASYYIKLAKLMLKYNLASTDRSKESVKDVIDALFNMSYTSDGLVAPVSWYETILFNPNDILTTIVLLFAIAVVFVKYNSFWYVVWASVIILSIVFTFFIPKDGMKKMISNVVGFFTRFFVK
jgi:hypothetical protein